MNSQRPLAAEGGGSVSGMSGKTFLYLHAWWHAATYKLLWSSLAITSLQDIVSSQGQSPLQPAGPLSAIELPQKKKKPGPKRDSKPAPSEKLERNRQAQRYFARQGIGKAASNMYQNAS